MSITLKLGAWRFYIGGFKGATMYEWQVGRLYGGICHLRGDYWAWKPWRRFSINWEQS